MMEAADGEMKAGNYAPAYIMGLEIAAMIKELYGENSENMASMYDSLGTTKLKMGEYEAALMYYLRAYDIRKAAEFTTQAEFLSSYLHLILVYFPLKQYKKYMIFAEKAITIYEKAPQKHLFVLACTYNNTGLVAELMQHYALALDFYQKGIMVLQKLLPAQKDMLQKAKNSYHHILQNHQNDLPPTIFAAHSAWFAANFQD